MNEAELRELSRNTARKEYADYSFQSHRDLEASLFDFGKKVQMGLLYQLTKEIIEFPGPKVCKHLTASNYLSKIEELGGLLSYKLAKAVVDGDDETALTLLKLVEDERAAKPKGGESHEKLHCQR